MIELIKKVIRWIRAFIKNTFHVENPNLPYYISIVAAIILFGLALQGFIELTDELVEDQLGPFDTVVTDWVIAQRTEGLTIFFKIMTEIGDTTAYVLITVALAAFFFFRHRSWKFIAQTVAVLLLATFTNMLLKEVVHRERPTIEHMVSVYTLSYPSGHSMSAMAFYGFLMYLCFDSKMRKRYRMLLGILLSFIILSIGISRIYLGVHFPSDVLGGFIGGFIWVNLCIVIFNILYLLRSRRRAART